MTTVDNNLISFKVYCIKLGIAPIHIFEDDEFYCCNTFTAPSELISEAFTVCKPIGGGAHTLSLYKRHILKPDSVANKNWPTNPKLLFINSVPEAPFVTFGILAATPEDALLLHREVTGYKNPLPPFVQYKSGDPSPANFLVLNTDTILTPDKIDRYALESAKQRLVNCKPSHADLWQIKEGWQRGLWEKEITNYYGQGASIRVYGDTRAIAQAMAIIVCNALKGKQTVMGGNGPEPGEWPQDGDEKMASLAVPLKELIAEHAQMLEIITEYTTLEEATFNVLRGTKWEPELSKYFQEAKNIIDKYAKAHGQKH